MKQDVFKKIGNILNELTEQYDYLKNTSKFNELELELFVANAQFLKDHAEVLRKLNLQENAQTGASHALPPANAIADAPEANPAQQLETFKAAPVDEPIVIPIDEKPELPQVQEPIALPQAEPQADESVVKEVTVVLTPPPPVEIPVTPKAPEQPEPVREHKFFEPVVQQIRNVPFTPAPEELKEDKQDVWRIEDTPASNEPDNGPIRHELTVDDTDWEETDEAEVFAEAEEMTEVIPVEPEKFAEPVKPVESPVAEQSRVFEFDAPKPKAPEPAPVAQEPVIAIEEVKNEPEPVLTINQRISAQMAQKTDAALAPISDLKGAITLNDKLLFVSELFNGYSLAYSEAIEILNRFNNFEEAERFLNANYVVKNNWASKSKTADKFYSFLKRRYA